MAMIKRITDRLRLVTNKSQDVVGKDQTHTVGKSKYYKNDSSSSVHLLSNDVANHNTTCHL